MTNGSGWVPIDNRHRAVGGRATRWLRQLPHRTSSQQLVDVQCPEGEYEGVDCAKYYERDRCLPRGQERRHGVGRPQDPVDCPRLATYLCGEPARQYRDERQRKTKED